MAGSTQRVCDSAHNGGAAPDFSQRRLSWRGRNARRILTYGAISGLARAESRRESLHLDAIELVSGGARAQIALRGAELRHWSVGGTPLIWQKDPAVWDETAPILFPIVGWTRGGQARVGGETFPLGLHGFARAMDFKARTVAPARVRLTLASSNETRALYPFAFWLCASYALSENSLTTTLTFKNRGTGPMPYACGLHPGFRWPFSGGAQGDYAICFSAAEEPFVPSISDRGLFLETRRPIPLDGRKLALKPALFAAEALCFLNARSRSLRFEHAEGAALTVETSNFPHFALWSRPGADFLAIECWTGHGDPDGFNGDLFEKPSMRILAPEAVAHHVARYSFSAEAPR
jgi:galactose mutarotase-like enzyme